VFSGFMVNAWIVASIVAVVGGAVGFFVVLRGSAFVAHAVPNGSFAGAAAASLVGVNTLLGLGVFAVGGALGIGFLSRRGRHDVATALTLVFMLGLGALFLSFSVQYAPEIYSLLSAWPCWARCTGACSCPPFSPTAPPPAAWPCSESSSDSCSSSRSRRP
jgi:zinc/manganese transport system permease protein